MRSLTSLGTRWLGVGLATLLAGTTLVLAMTGRLDLYINPDSNWFAISMAVVTLIGAAASFLLPLGAEEDHGHDHGDGGHTTRTHGHDHVHAEEHEAVAVPKHAAPEALDPTAYATRAEFRAALEAAQRGAAEPTAAIVTSAQPAEPGAGSTAPVASPHEGRASAEPRSPAHTPGRAWSWGRAATVTGGVLATGVVLASAFLPPASLSAELALSRDLGTAPLFGGDDVVQLATTGDLSTFGIGEWSTVFATTPDPRAFDGAVVTLSGFVAPATDGDPDNMRLTRLVVTHCVIDAQPAMLPVTQAQWAGDYAVGEWIEITGTIRETDTGALVLAPDSITPIDEPADPYEY